MTIFAKDNEVKVYSGNLPEGQTKIATLDLGSQKSVNSDKTLAYDPQYTRSGAVLGSAYFFNMGHLLDAAHGQSCVLFEAETDYPMDCPRRSTGADAIGNHTGKEIFGEETFTFWILFDQANYIIPNSGNYYFEAHIMCTEI